MLVAMQKVDPQDVQDLNQLFDKYDRNQDGVLQKQDLISGVTQFRNHVQEMIRP
jgi:Ca2+-binding EF-hand superfamily protein